MLMKKLSLKSAVAALLLCSSTLSATAQTAYGLALKSWWTDDYYSGLQLATLDLSALNQSASTELTYGDGKFANYDVKTGVTVGNKYYAVLEYYDEQDENTYIDLYTVNFTTDEFTKITKESYGNDNKRNAGYNMSHLAYDAASSTLYGIEYAYDETLKDNATTLYKVSTADGSLTKAAAFSGNYNALLAKDGKLYLGKTNGTGWFNLGVDLYEVTDGALASTAACSVSSVKGYNSSTAAHFTVADDGTIYVQCGTSISKFDFAGQTSTWLGNTDRSFQGMTFSKSTENGSGSSAGGDEGGQEEEEESETRLLVSTTHYGDVMGYVGADDDMGKILYFYNTDNQLSRVVELGRGYTELQKAGDYSVTYYSKYLYNDNNQLDTVARYQTGLYDFGDMAYKLRSTLTGFQYDEQGRVTVEPTSAYTFNYEYDEQGNTVKSTKVSASGQTIQVLEYSNFVGKNKPKTVVSTCPQGWNIYIYNAVLTYDDNKNVVSEVRSRDGVTYYKKTYTYDGTFLTEDVEYDVDAEGVETPTAKTEYTAVDGDADKVKSLSYTYYNGNWSKSATYSVDEYVEFEDMADYVRIDDLTATLDETAINTVNLTFTAPVIAQTGCNFDIYRRGELIATKGVMDLYKSVDETTGDIILCYSDSALYNGDYDYFVQPVIATYYDDDPEAPAEEAESTGYYISNPVSINVALNLPAVTDLKQGVPFTNDEGSQSVAISWTNPEYPEAYGFISNNLHFLRYQTEDSSTDDPTATSLDGKFDGIGNQVFILTRYQYGKAISDTLTVNLSVTEGINTVSTDGTFSLNGRELTLASNASVAIYGMSGQLEESKQNAGNVDLSALKPGAYIVCVTSEGKSNAYKVILK